MSDVTPEEWTVEFPDPETAQDDRVYYRLNYLGSMATDLCGVTTTFAIDHDGNWIDADNP